MNQYSKLAVWAYRLKRVRYCLLEKPIKPLLYRLWVRMGRHYGFRLPEIYYTPRVMMVLRENLELKEVLVARRLL